MRLRAGRGLGDSIYLRPIVDHFVQRSAVTVLSNYPAVFADSGARVEPFTRDARCVVANYTLTIKDQRVTQFDAMCRSVGVPQIPMRFTWKVKNCALVDEVNAKADGRPVLLVHGGRIPMQRSDVAAKDLMPRREAFLAALGAVQDCFTVRIGADPDAYPLPVDLDLNSDTTVSDLLDLAAMCDGVIAQCSFAVPLAECFGKPLLAIWSAQGLRSTNPVLGQHLRCVTPRKVLQYLGCTTECVIDDEIGSTQAYAWKQLVAEELACAS